MIEQGVNGPIYALLAVDSGNYNVGAGAQWTREKLVDTILDAQMDNGAWSLFGDTPSSDLTGMAIASLSPYTDREDVKNAIDRAVTWLSDNQADTGGYIEEVNGGETAESIAQVIIGLTANNMDPVGSEFTKDGGHLLDRLAAFQKEDGGFSHLIESSEPDKMTSTQVLLALAAYEKYQNNEGSVFDLTSAIANGESPDSGTGMNPFVIGGILLVILAAVVIAYVTKRKRR